MVGFRRRASLPGARLAGGTTWQLAAARDRQYRRAPGSATVGPGLRRLGGEAPVRPPFTAASLRDVSILVIANAGTDSTASWALPTRSAFAAAEIDAVEAWVRGGGALFLISDHMPAAGATADLARRFGAQFTNGYSFQARLPNYPGDLFTRADSTLLDHAITRGRGTGERIDSILTFTGQAFQVDERLRVVLRFGPTGFSYLPVRAGEGFDSTTPRLYSGGWAHAAVGEIGAGRVALVGEAAMFSGAFGPERDLHQVEPFILVIDVGERRTVG
jgi:hypothetical protein